MRRIRIWLSFILFGLACAACTGSKTPGSVVIIGGGPAGLATAIEARLAGARVTVVEKRDAYERVQQLFLLGHTLDLLKTWKVESPELKKMAVEEKRIGFIKISALEEALLKRAEELGVRVIQDDFVEVSKDERSVILRKEGSVPYDILVAADGSHSPVRQSLGIEVDLMGQGKAGAALISSGQGQEGASPIDISPPMQHGASFVQKFQLPGFNFFFLQGPLSATQEDFVALCKASGWNAQAEKIASGDAILLLDVDVYLQKTRQFSLADRGALLVGDAAGTGSFFRGTGANHALATAEIAGRFFKTGDYERFEWEMGKTTNELIEDCAFLFFAN